MKEDKTINFIGTHSGKFHCDDITACTLLLFLYPEAEIIRSRKTDDLNKCEIVVDVGGAQNLNEPLFVLDHHQPEGAGVRKNGVPYASAGLVWKVFGESILQKLEPEATEDKIAYLLNALDAVIMQPIDAHDCGYTPAAPIGGFSFSIYISLFNPFWNEESSAEKGFMEAIDHVSYCLKRLIKKESGIFDAIGVVEEGYQKQEKEAILVLDRYVPWQDTLFKNGWDAILYVIYPGFDPDEWKVRCVPKEANGWENRLPLPDSWGGLRNEEFSRVSGVKDVCFCHANLFLAGAKSRESAIALAKKSLAISGLE